ncbi:MAG: hypothetical protein O7H39_01275 [Gammaproteobacteria bacterium]|nr:hypothetical protein [Gammaproteobacteria bacterium]
MTTCVWVGVFVIVLFNLRLGWSLSGLVVPGYLAPLIFVKPWAAAVVVFEACLTYLIVYWFSERGSKVAFWNALFGRDRFFALLVVSIAIRLIFDTWLLPDLASTLEDRFDLAVDFRNNLHSFGLIIICLLANQFWKTGLLRSVVPVAVPILLTALVIRFVLMEFTNFSIGNLGYIYEDVAASIMASPKAYMILILAAFIASRMNLHYGWDSNGILIPALLALQWYQPEKILVSFVEAGIILLAANALLRLPLLARVNIEGGHKLLLFFNISFAYKLLLGWSVLWLDLDINATDYYGFGYLLTTLLAIKMHDKEIVARLSRATLQTSLTAVVIASLLAFALSRFDWRDPLVRETPATANTRGIDKTWKPLTEHLKDETLTAYQHRSVHDINKPLAIEIDQFTRALGLLRHHADRTDPARLAEAASRFAAINFEIVEHPDWILIRERQPSLGWGTYALARKATRKLSLEIPAPLEDGHLSHISAYLFELYGAQSLAIAGNQIRLNRNRDPISTLDQTSFFQAFHRFNARNDILQIRGLTDLNRRRLGQRHDTKQLSELRLDGSIPEQLDVTRLQKMVGDFRTYFEPPNMSNIQRQSSAAGFAELFLTSDSVRQLLYAALSNDNGGPLPATALIQAQYLTERLSAAERLIAPKNSNTYRQLSQAESLYFDEQVLEPMLAWTDKYTSYGRTLADLWANDTCRETLARDKGEVTSPCRTLEMALNDLAAIHNAAGVLRHEVNLLVGDRGDPLLYLGPTASPPIRHSAFVALRVGASSPVVVQAPRPRVEPGSLEFASRLFLETRAKALIISGVHSATNTDQSADVLRLANKQSLFNLASQHLVRAAADTPLTLVQIRGLRARTRVADRPFDILVSASFVPNGETAIEEPALEKYFKRHGLRAVQIDGSLATVGYENHSVLQNRYLEQSQNKSFLTQWVSRQARLAQRHQSSNRQLLAQLASLGLPVVEASLADRLASGTPERAITAELEARLRHYQNSTDVLVLADLLDRHAWHFEALLDRRTQQIYLLAGHDRHQIAGAFLLGTGTGEGYRIAQTALARTVARFVERRDSWLTIVGPS